MKTRLTILALSAALSACALGPDYQRPALEIPPAYRLQTETAAPASFGDLGWWQIYGDPRLQQLLAVAVKNNFDVRIAAARVEQAQATLGSTGLALLPKLSASGGLQRQEQSASATVPGADRIGSAASAGLSLSYELDFWGRLRRTRESARAQLLATDSARQAVLVTLVSSVATQYFALLALDEQLQITEATLSTREAFLKLTQAQFDRGTVSGLDVSTAQAQLATAQANVPDLERRIAQTENALSLLLGQNPGPVVRAEVGPDAGAATLAPDLPPGLPSRLLERRPDLQAAEQALVAANAQVGAAKAALFPSISLTGSLGSLSGSVSDLFSAGSQTWSLGVNLLQPLLDADRNLYRVDFADAGKRVALLQYEQAVKTAFREVADALVARQKSAEFESAEAALVRAQGSAHEIALARYKVGYSSYFDVINADRDLFTAKLALSSAHLNTLLASVQLYQALGGGWQTPAP